MRRIPTVLYYLSEHYLIKMACSLDCRDNIQVYIYNVWRWVDKELIATKYSHLTMVDFRADQHQKKFPNQNC